MPNPPGNYSRIKTWGTSDTVLASDINAEFDNVLNNFNPEMLAAYSQNVAQMQIQTNPGAIGSESLATSIAGELERLRFQINAITGNTYWYTSPAATIAQLNSLISASAFGNRITSGLTTGTTGSVMPAFLVAAGGSSQVATLKATATAFNYQINGSSYVVSADTTISGLTLAPSSNNTAVVSDLTLPQAGTASTQILGENGSVITIGSVGTQISNLRGSYAAFKTAAGEYFIGYVESSTQLSNCYRGYFYDSSSNPVTRGTLSNGDSITLMKLSWIFLNTTGTLSVTYNNPKASGSAPASPAVNDFWLDTSVNIWKQYSGTVWATANVTLIGTVIQDTSGCVASRSYDFFQSFADTNNLELFADSQNSGTTVRSRLPDTQVSVQGSLVSFSKSILAWDFTVALDTGSQVASTMYYFYLDPNGRPWISKTAPYDRRTDLRGYYHPNRPWRCLGYGWSNSGTLLENVESFYRGDDATPVSNITAASNPVLPYNIIQREQIITLTGVGGAFTQVLPPPAQLRGKFLTFIRTDNNISTAVTIQSWGTAAANPTGTVSFLTTPTKITGLSSTAGLVAGQLISGQGISPNTTLVALEGSTAGTMSAAAFYSVAGGTINFSSPSGYAGTVGQQTAYAQYGINGFFTIPLYMQGETLTVTSDGFAYFIVSHYIPPTEYQSGPLTIGATTTPGTKGSATYDTFYWRRVGGNCHFRYDCKLAAGSGAGSGDYKITFPAGLTVDTTRVQANDTAIGASTPTTFSIIGGGYFFNTTPTPAVATAYVRTSTTFGIHLNGSGVWGAGVGALTVAFEISVQGSFPVTGWYGI